VFNYERTDTQLYFEAKYMTPSHELAE